MESIQDGWVYKITNKINGKHYIGITTKTPEKRWYEHITISKSGNDADMFAIHKALRKYGLENFSFEKVSHLTSEFPMERGEFFRYLGYEEQYYIKLYNSKVPNGYNMTDGGECCSDSLKKKVNQYGLDGEFIRAFDSVSEAGAATGILSSCVSACCVGNTKTSGGYQWMFAEEANDFDPIPPYVDTSSDWIKRCVNQYCLDGRYVQTFDSMAAASVSVDVQHSSIYLCCKGNVLRAGDYQWRYADECDGKADIDSVVSKVHKVRPVCQYSLEGKFLKEWDMVSQASKECSIDGSLITSCCKGNVLRAGDYQWRYADECDGKADIERIERYYFNKRSVVQFDLGGKFLRLYDKISDVGFLDASSICAACNTTSTFHKKSVGGYMWRYRDEWDGGDIEPYEANYGWNRKIVCEYDLDGKFVRCFDSLQNAADTYGIEHSGIVQCCKGQIRKYKNRQWRTYDSVTTSDIEPYSEQTYDYMKKKVAQYCLDGKFIRTYDSVTEAAEDNSLLFGNVAACCRGNSKKSGNWMWRYIDDTSGVEDIEPYEKPVNYKSQSITIRHNDTYMTFKTKKDASFFLNQCHSYVSEHLKKGTPLKHRNGTVWDVVDP